MSLITTVTSDCKYIAVVATDTTNGSYLTGDIVVTDPFGSVTTITSAITFATAGATTTVAVSLVSDTNGVFTIELKQNSVVVTSTAVVVHCNVDCCLAKLTDELVGCDCSKCNPTLVKAQKVFLLIKSAEESAKNFDGTNGGYLNEAYNKYKKAVDLCDTSCGCDS
jgi:hypothetical protein